ncbi:hypothetical protein CPB97_002071 [Podila verticillata]|nr:hypothetical protein CPB97_002071 [Podila verticillata]
MIFARTLVVLCVAAVAMAMDGLRCKCNNEIWTKNTCSNIGKEIKWCYGAAQDFCETGNRGNDFRNFCSQRGNDCYAVDC